MPLQTVNTATGKLAGSFPGQSRQDVLGRIQQAHAACMAWKKTGCGIREFVNIKTVRIGEAPVYQIIGAHGAPYGILNQYPDV